MQAGLKYKEYIKVWKAAAARLIHAPEQRSWRMTRSMAAACVSTPLMETQARGRSILRSGLNHGKAATEMDEKKPFGEGMI